MVLATARNSIENGAVIGGEEFLALYESAPDLEHVELIEGIVYMPSPVSIDHHGEQQAFVLDWLTNYRWMHDDLRVSGPGTVVLDAENVLEPDAILFRKRDGQTNDRGYLTEVPELVVEVANTSASRDLHQKKEAYRRNGVLEYIVWRVQDEAIDWFALVDGQFEERRPGKTGIIESKVFAGLRLNVPAMLAMDRPKVLAALR